ncbi:MAG: 50S ribosomal protein L9 [Calditrichaeota bacterium]|nr:50S ribosomal protein L9 [Calditrichota bacterium]
MKIILREQVDNVGQLGETVNVKDGYARNFLIPQGLAYPATDSFLNVIKGEVRRKQARDAKNKAAAEILSKEMESVTVTITATVGEEDKMFGSVTSSNIAEKLHEAGFKIEKKQIQLHEPIKALGIYHVPVKLHSEIHVDVKVWVVKEEEAVATETEAEPKKKSKAKSKSTKVQADAADAVDTETPVEEASAPETVVEENNESENSEEKSE